MLSYESIIGQVRLDMNKRGEEEAASCVIEEKRKKFAGKHKVRRRKML